MAQEVKPFKTIEEQIAILEDRGLIIDDKEAAKKCLSNLNYYRLSAYHQSSVIIGQQKQYATNNS